MKYLNYLCILLIFVLACSSKTDIGLTSYLLNNFKITRINDNPSLIKYIGTSDNSHLKILKYEKVDESGAQDIMSEKLFFIKTLYRDIHSPYPGQISNSIKCTPEFYPVEKKADPYPYYLIKASERFTYGVCSQDLVGYNVLLFFKKCGLDFYVIEYFVPATVQPDENLVYEIECQADA